MLDPNLSDNNQMAYVSVLIQKLPKSVIRMKTHENALWQLGNLTQNSHFQP
jgi:hypothetical protein